MKKLTAAILALLTLTTVTPVMAFGPLDIEAGMAMNSQYVWRGMVLSPDAVMQTTVGVGLLGLQLEFFGNMDMNDTHSMQSQFTETDWTVGYELGLPFFSLGVGGIHYSFPNSVEPATSELYLSAEAHVLLGPSLTVYQDVDQIKGAYWEANVNHSFPVTPAVDLDLTGGLGLGSPSYTHGYFGETSLLPQVPSVPGSATMTDYYLTAAVPFDLALFFTVTPSVTYTSLLGDIKTIVESSPEDATTVVWGLNATFKF